MHYAQQQKKKGKQQQNKQTQRKPVTYFLSVKDSSFITSLVKLPATSLVKKEISP